jgi:hypothetical membrane protein
MVAVETPRREDRTITNNHAHGPVTQDRSVERTGFEMTTIRLTVGVWAWIVSAALIVIVELVVPLGWTVPWDPASRTISELGAVECGVVDFADGARDVCSPWHALANTGWIASGILLAGGALLLKPQFGVRWGTVAVGLLILTGFSTSATGIFPLDSHPELHLITALPGFLATPLALVALAANLWKQSRLLALTALGLGVLSCLGTVFTVAWVLVGGPLGLWERLAIYPVYAWMVLAAVLWLRNLTHRA